MNYNNLHIFIGVLLQEDYERHYMRRSRRFLRDTLNPFEMPDYHFKQLFHLNKFIVRNLIAEIEPHIRLTPYGIPIHLKVLSTLHFLAVGSKQNPCGQISWISLSQTLISRYINEICSAITRHLLPLWVKFPTTAIEMARTKQGFFEKWGIRGTIGVIDGTHVDIIAPPTTDENNPPFIYINRKGKHSINVMLICDANTRILACSARFPGSVHDAAIWQMSSIRNFMKQNFNNGDKITHIIGDAGYPLEPWLYKAYAHCEPGSKEELFNRELKTVRNVIERTNGILKGRFGALSRFSTLRYHPLRAANIIYSACVCHNMAVLSGDLLPDDQIEYEENENEERLHPHHYVDADLLHLGRDARNLYVQVNF